MPRLLRYRLLAAVPLPVACWAMTASAMADNIELSGGVLIDGTVLRKTDGGPKPHLVLELDPGLKIAIPQSRVRKSISDKELAWYQAAAEAAGEDPEKHCELAIACSAKRLSEQRDYHFRRAIELDPDHSRARKAMGYVEDGNDWVLYRDQQRRNGMIQTSSGWQVPEVYVRHEQMDQANAAARIWESDFAKMRTSYLKGDKRAEDAWKEMQAIDDPLATQALSKALKESRTGPDPQSLRKFYVQKLGSFKVSAAVQALVETGYDDPDSFIRDLALEELNQYGAASAVGYYLSILSGTSHTTGQVSAALRALNHFPDKELWRQYVDALITTHKQVKQKGAGMQAGMNNRGGMGLGMGGKAEVVTNHVKNPAALELLKTISEEDGVNFGYDQASWRQYFADKLMGSTGDLRRDP
ncbi:hypothetical protein NHH03_18110 [Stieleria sp. TO1_6]|uniref:hypothetical protein n=1 Tax=Stieleria tagensis TaxID=2956795 RepID=UPI00209B5E17|nr:hypothetical protein [Stieleria tagensis]MCO8123666.1 hypothetical protein [Stieleria tagensis]